MYYPTLDQVKTLAGQGNLVPVYREINAAMETPFSAYLKIARGSYSFLLESVEGEERLARYSFIGTEPYRVLKTGPSQTDGDCNPLTLIQAELDKYQPVATPGLPRFIGGAVGYLGYECVRHFEPRVPRAERNYLGLPEAVFLLTDTLLVFDHLRHKIKVVSHARLREDIEEDYLGAVQRIERLIKRLSVPLAEPDRQVMVSQPASNFRSNVTRKQYYKVVHRVKKYIEAGDIIQAVLSQRLERPTSADPFDIYRALRAVNPSPYMYYLQLDDCHIIGASPEMLVRVDDGEVSTHPIAGTRPRGRNEEEDRAMENDLRNDAKEKAEHIMLVDLGRNDIGRVSRPGTVQMSQLMDVERYSHVMHLVSHVTGRLQAGVTCYDALRACFPAGTVSGAPKIRAMEIIAELEGQQRGPYAGAVGYFGFSGNMDTAITIRTIVLKDGVAYLQAGGGVVFDSTPQGEYQETLHKVGALVQAIHEAERKQ